ncbi:MAG: HdeD family acid-resistance protein [Caldilineaceae bacterium]|nr:HdeD family acid-resistance protein [Caldilineaceae bacterium]
MVTQFAQNWWAVVLRGVLAILFGLSAMFWPGITLAALVLMYGAYAMADGLFAVVAAIMNRTHGQRWWTLLEGLVGIAAGFIAFLWPGLTTFALLYLIAAWAIVTGIFEIVAAIELRREITGEWMLVANGVLSVLFGLLVTFFPGAGALGIVWLIALYAWIFGLLMLMLGFQMRGWVHNNQPPAALAGRGI